MRNGKLILPVVLFVFFLFLFPPEIPGAQLVSDGFSWPEEADGWKAAGSPAVYGRNTLFDYMNGAAEVYLSYNLRTSYVRKYTKQGKPDIVAEVYHVSTSDDAYGIFMLERNDPDAGIGQGSEFGGGMLRFWKGTFFVSIFAEGEGKDGEAAVLKLGNTIAASIGKPGTEPRLIGFIPGPDFMPVCFVRSHVLLNRCFFVSHRNIFELGPDVEAVVARSGNGRGGLRVMILRYPSGARASAAYDSFTRAYMPEAGQRKTVLTEDGTWTRAAYLEKFVTVVFGAQTEAEADRIGEEMGKKIVEVKP